MGGALQEQASAQKNMSALDAIHGKKMAVSDHTQSEEALSRPELSCRWKHLDEVFHESVIPNVKMYQHQHIRKSIGVHSKENVRLLG